MKPKPRKPKPRTFYEQAPRGGRGAATWRAWQLSALTLSALALGGSWTLSHAALSAARPPPVAVPGQPPSFTVLLAGRDIAYCYYRTPCRDQNTRTGLWQPPNTDTIMLLKVNGTRVNALSIPRDTNVGPFRPGAGIAVQKVNSQYFRAGPQALASAVEQITGERVDYYAVVNTSFVAAVVNALGGLDVTVPDIPAYGDPSKRGIYFDDNAADLHVHLTPGRHHLSGPASVAYLRMRKGFGDDYGRMDHQKAAVAQLVDKLKTPSGLAGALPTIFRGLSGSVESNLDPALLEQMLPYLNGYQLNFATLPTSEVRGTTNLAVDRAELARVWGAGAQVPTQRAMTARIFDASGANLGGKVAWALGQRGVRVAGVEAEPPSGERSQVFTLDQVAGASAVARWLSLPSLQGLRFPVPSGEVGVYLGADAAKRYAELARLNVGASQSGTTENP